MDEYTLLRNKGRRYLRKGILFLGICLVISHIVGEWTIPFANLISESAIIAGWVALWRPMEIFLYELPELRDQTKA